jgi:hypothetical protein
LSKLLTDGIDVVSEKSENVHIEVCLATFTVDHLARYEAFGRKICFRGIGFICCFCGANGEEIQTNRTRKLLTNIPREEYNNHGLIRESIFEGLPNIDLQTLSPMEISHDLCEGVLEKIITLIVTSIHQAHGVSQGLLSQTFENCEIYKEGKPHFYWKYGEMNRKDQKRPSTIGFKVRGSAIQKTDFKVH